MRIAVAAVFILLVSMGNINTPSQGIMDGVDSMYLLSRKGGRLPERLVEKYTTVDSAVANSRNTYHWYAGRDGNTIYDSIRLMVIEASNITCYEKYLVTFNPQGEQMGILKVALWCDRNVFVSEALFMDYKWVTGNTISVSEFEAINDRRWQAQTKFTKTYQIAPDGTIGDIE